MTESQRAKAWRNKCNLTMEDLAGLTGYSKEAIFRFECGTNSLGQPHNAHAWRRYKLACLAVRVMLIQKIDTVDKWHWV